MGTCSLEATLMALRDAAFDKDESVRDQIMFSLQDLGRHYPELVLMSCHNYLLKHSQLALGHRTVILQSMERIVKDNIRQVGQPLARKLISMASDELTRSDEASSGYQDAAMNSLLVTLGSDFINQVLEELTDKLQSGVQPHFFVVRTLGDLALANPKGVIPHLRSILQTLLPMLSMAKREQMKLAFTAALGLFSRSILQFHKESNSGLSPGMRKDEFSHEIYVAYDVLFNNWLQCKDVKLRSMVLETVGHMVHLLSDDRLNQELPKLIPGILALYKRHPEPLYVTQCLRHTLEAAMKIDTQALEVHVDTLLPALHQQICVPLEPNSDLSLKNHQEILQCFTVLAKVSVDALLKLVLQKLTQSNERVRMGTLSMVNHLISHAPAQLESKRFILLSGMKLPLHDNDSKVKKVIIQVIDTMANHNYLELEGGLVMVEFVVRQCALPTSTKTQAGKAGDVPAEELKATASGLMERLTAMEEMADVLWPSLLEFLVPAQYTNSLSVLCSSLEYLARKKQESRTDVSLLDYDERRDLPGPQALLARLLFVSSLPYLGGGRGLAALRLLRVMSPNIHSAVRNLWERELPVLIQHLTENSADSLLQQQWENRLLVFLSRTVETISDERWTCHLSEEMTRHISHCHGPGPSQAKLPQEKQFVYKCVGITLQHTTNTDVVNRELQEMLLSVQHNEATEREGVAVAVGFCAMTHLDETLSKLEDFVRLDLLKKTVHFFNALMEKMEGDTDKMKSTLILCYGYVALYADESLVLPKIEGNILKHVLSLSNTKVLGVRMEGKDTLLKLSLIKAVTLVAKAVLGNRHRLSFSFGRKDELLSYMHILLKGESKVRLRTQVRQCAMVACTYLIRLEPSLNKAFVTELIKTCLDSVLGVLPIGGETSNGGSSDKEREELYTETANALQELLNEILLHDMSPDGLYAVFKHAEGWLIATKDYERERAMEVLSKLLSFYLQKLDVRNNLEVSNLGVMIGCLVPRCTDPLLAVRHMAIDSLYALFYIQLRYDGLPVGQSDELVEHLKVIKSQLDQVDSHSLLRLCTDVAKVISKHLPQDQMSSLIFKLFDGLDDPFVNCCNATSVVMNTLIRSCGTSLHAYVAEILKVLHIRLQWMTGEQMRVSVIHFVSILASQNTHEVVACLLLSPLPFDRFTGEVWSALAGEVTLATTVMELLLQKLSKHWFLEEIECPLEEGGGCGCVRSEPLAIVCALNEMLSNPDSAEPVSTLYPQLFSSLLLHTSASLGEDPPKTLVPIKGPSKDWRAQGKPKERTIDPCGFSVETLQAMLTRGRNKDVVVALWEDGGWGLMRKADRHHEGVSLLAKAMAVYAKPHLGGIVKRLISVLVEGYRNQRATVIAFLGELLNDRVVSELKLTDSLVASLASCAKDPTPAVRLLALRGLANIASGDPGKVGFYSLKLLGAMVSGISEEEDPKNLIALEAMQGLCKVLAQLKESDLRGSLINIVLAVKPFFETADEKARACAFAVFGSLSRLAEGESRSRFAEQVHASLVGALLHLNDGSQEVVSACKSSLRLVGPFLGSDTVNATLQVELAEERASEWEYWEFLGSFSKLVAVNFPDRVNAYLTGTVGFFKSTLPEIRGNAVSLAGLLFQNLPKKSLQTVTSENICVDIISMLHDPVPSVRIRAAQTLSLLY